MSPARLSQRRHGRERGKRRPAELPGRSAGQRRGRGRAQDHESHREDPEGEGGVRRARRQLGAAVQGRNL